MAMYKIMLLDDDKFILASLQRSLKKQKDWQIETFFDPVAALKQAGKQRYDLFLSDYQMPGTDGVKFLTKIKSLQPEAMRIMLSGQDNVDFVESDIKQAGIYRFITKPVQTCELIDTIKQALQYYQARQKSACG